MFYTDTWIYFHVPKTSGTNILLNAEEYGDITKGYRANPERHNPIWYWETNTKLEGKKLYTTVRNPYARIVSLWNHLNHFKKVTFEDFFRFNCWFYFSTNGHWWSDNECTNS